MTFDFLSPVSNVVLEYSTLLSPQTLGQTIKQHSKQSGIPDLDDVDIAIIGVLENRNDVNYIGHEFHFNDIRKALYSLFLGNWHTKIADLGDIKRGNTVEDTYFVLQTTISTLLKKKVIPIILGGSQDLTYANYRAYDDLMPMINIVNVDSNFDLGNSALPIKSNSYLGKIILEKPFNLFNYSTIGYQTYFNSQEEIDLMEKLYFESYRLGEISKSIQLVEPVMRDAHIVSLDLKSIKTSEISLRHHCSPNGFDGKEACAISRYAGISNKVSSFGVYEYNGVGKNETTTVMLIAQILWYFIEGVNFRIMDDDFKDETHYQKYNVLIEDQELIFFKSIKTERWWIEIPFFPEGNNKLKKHTLLPCMYDDYVEATHGKIPKRWYKAYKKSNL